ncbi:MAG: 3-deoxy-D-manno-octulosonic acid transferase [Planctomycetota bacterium]|nr:3-deoxy-D-manno-octulosonic acid transferase [Planctomycetota bacterium]
MNILYALALVASSPIWLMRMFRHGKYRRDFSQRLGLSPRLYGLQPVIWIHGVSVGEVNAAKALVAEIHSQLPDYRVVITSTTDTGLAAAERLFAPAHRVFRWPMDFTFAVSAAVRRVRPGMVILTEGDVWPNFVRECRRRKIPVLIVNARLGPRKGFPRYRLVRPLAGRLFNSLTAIGVQHETYAEMFRSLGVREEKLFVTGMMKYDTAEIAGGVAGTDALAAAIGISPDDKLLVAGGTGRGEEQIVLDAFAEVIREHPGVRLAIVPRKPERFDEVARLISTCGFTLIRRSEHLEESSKELPAGAIILGDTMGELRKFYALAYAVFVGRSLVPEGGSDMIEAAALAKPVAFGPHTFNFPQAETMVAAGCARRVADTGELAGVWTGWLDNPAVAADMGGDARQFVQSQTGATRRNVELICRILGRNPPLAPGGVATDMIR